MTTNETIYQLDKMGKLIDEYGTAITTTAAGKIYDWLDGVNIFERDSGLHDKTRKEQADSLIDWFENRIADMKKGITP